MSESGEGILGDLQETARMMGLDDSGDESELRARITGNETNTASGPTPKSRQPHQTRAPRRPSNRKKTESKSPPLDDTEPSPAEKRKRIGADRRLVEALTGTYLSAGMACQGLGALQTIRSPVPPTEPVPLMRLGLVLTDEITVSQAVDAWMEVADQNPKVKRMLIRAMEGTAIATLIGVHLSIVMRAGLLPGVVPFNPQTNGHGGVPV